MFAQNHIWEYMMLHFRSCKYPSARSLHLTLSLMSNRRVMFECHKQRGLMHSLGCSVAEGPHNILFAPLRAKLESNGGGGDKRRVSPSNNSVAAAHVICDPAAEKI